MFDDPIRPIRALRSVEAVGDIGIPRKPSRGQLRTWLSFAKRVGKRAAPATPEAQTAPPSTAAPVQHHSDHQLDIEI